jgi:DNA-binding Xre family transcriptional regulator
LSDSFIAKLESITHQTISIDTLEEIAEVLECDIRDFFDKDVIENSKK